MLALVGVVAAGVVLYRFAGSRIDRWLGPMTGCDDAANDLGVAFELEGGRRR